MINFNDPENVVSKSMTVAVGQERAFRVWTEQIRDWWPAGHSLSGDPQSQVFIEGWVGGRFFERASDGVEFDWGAVEIWEPPNRLAFSWYLGSRPEMPTRVEVKFVPLNDRLTRVELEHRGPELVGELWWQRKHRFSAGWASALAQFATFVG